MRLATTLITDHSRTSATPTMKRREKTQPPLNRNPFATTLKETNTFARESSTPSAPSTEYRIVSARYATSITENEYRSVKRNTDSGPSRRTITRVRRREFVWPTSAGVVAAARVLPFLRPVGATTGNGPA